MAEYRASSQEIQIAESVSKDGGYILRPTLSLDELSGAHAGKSVYLVLQETNLARITNGRLGFHIERAIFHSEATLELATILRQSRGLADVQFPGVPTGFSTAPIPIINALQGLSLQTVEFARHKFTSQDINKISEALTTHSIVFVHCTLPSDAVTNLKRIKGLKTVWIFKCDLRGSPQSQASAVKSLRSAGVEVNIE